MSDKPPTILQDEYIHHPQPTAPVAVAPGNPTTLGFFSLATTTMLVGFYIYGLRGVTALSMMIGQVAIVGGVGMFISGYWCYQQGATFATTAFGMYGLFYFSLGVALYPETGVAAAYATTADYNTALGLYLLPWFLLAFLMWPVTWKLNVGLCVLFALVSFYFFFLTVGFLLGNTSVIKTGGAFGIIVGAWGFVLGVQNLYEVEECVFQFPNPSLARKRQ